MNVDKTMHNLLRPVLHLLYRLFRVKSTQAFSLTLSKAAVPLFVWMVYCILGRITGLVTLGVIATLIVVNFLVKPSAPKRKDETAIYYAMFEAGLRFCLVVLDMFFVLCALAMKGHNLGAALGAVVYSLMVLSAYVRVTPLPSANIEATQNPTDSDERPHNGGFSE